MLRKEYILAVVGIPIAVFVLLVSLDASAANQLQFMVVGGEDFDFMDLSSDMTIAVCNPTSFPTSFEKIYGQIYYKSTDVAELTLWGTDIPANSAKDIAARFKLNGMSVLQLFIGALGSVFTGQQLDFEPQDFSYYIKIEKSILGFIPYSEERHGMNSQNMFTHPNNWKCYETTNIDEVVFEQETIEEKIDIPKYQIEKPNIQEEKERWIKYDSDLLIIVNNDFKTTVWNDETIRIHGKLLSSSDNSPLVSHQIFLKDSITEKVLAKGFTDNSGEFIIDWKVSPFSKIDNTRDISVVSGSLKVELGEITVR